MDEHPDLEFGSFTITNCCNPRRRDPFDAIILNNVYEVTLKFKDPKRTSEDARDWVQNNFIVENFNHIMLIQGVETLRDAKFVVKVMFEIDSTKNGLCNKPRIVIPNVYYYNVEIKKSPAENDRPRIITKQFVPLEPVEYFTEEAQPF
jgi:hypothetical protein